MMRCLFVSLVVGNVLLSFYDIPGGYFDEQGGDDLTPAEEALLNGAFMNLMLQGQSQRQDGPPQLVCTKCKKPESESSQGVFRCSRCGAVQREVRYCSR
jgi:hypothetical protein